MPLVSEDLRSEMPSERSIDVATYRAQRLGGILTLGSFQSPRAGIRRPSGSPSLRYFESASREARRSLGEVWWGRTDRRSETKSGRVGVRRFCERRIDNLRSFRPFPRHILCMIAKHPVSPGQFDWQNDRHHAVRFAFLLSAHPWALRPYTLLPFPTMHFEGVLRGRRIAVC